VPIGLSEHPIKTASKIKVDIIDIVFIFDPPFFFEFKIWVVPEILISVKVQAPPDIKVPISSVNKALH